MSSPAAVLRDGHVTEVDSKELVQETSLLEAGDVVPADMRLWKRTR